LAIDMTVGYTCSTTSIITPMMMACMWGMCIVTSQLEWTP
jgi:hypothetical protein